MLYRDTELEDLDLPAVLNRRPEICLIDELAHTNAPGLEHAKRYEDVEDILNAGIDVFSTLNVQHLESLNDRVAELSGVRVRETVPDAILGRADEVVLIDLTPEALIERLRTGKVYAPDRDRLRAEQLLQDREPHRPARDRPAPGGRGGRGQAPGHRAGRVRGRTPSPTRRPQAVGERLLALVEPYPGAQRLVRRAWRSAQRLGGPLDLLWVKPPGYKLSDDDERSLHALRQLASVLGARLLVEESDQVPEAIAEVAAQRGTTYILMGRARPARGVAPPAHAAPQRLMELLPGVDVRIVADRARRRERAET